jgi:hypothetical protein
MQLDPDTDAATNGRGLEDWLWLVLEHELGASQGSHHIHM